ncbi:ribonuclease HI family protein [Vagococcus elongatus]|uniref:Ribonuclease HI n=1 Tax=Vagococcus elongatus TaxID=180344 RepID=A0A430B5T8_9ENTE|nr:ribonuclease HI family protein [Vagococcus elongatus]RSU15670.1 ribonuclease HI [Vagococcus elongatus]
MLKIYIDAATKGNPGPSGIGIILLTETIYEQLHFPIPEMSNHEAEFFAAVKALEIAIEKGLNTSTTFLYTDSKVVSKVIDSNHTKNPLFQPYLIKLNELLAKFPLVMIQWIPESKNKGAHQLARQGLHKSLKSIS